MAHGLILEITCPECHKATHMDFTRVPAGRFDGTCQGCGHKFPFSKELGLNCNITSQTGVEAAPSETGDVSRKDQDGWRVNHPACEGNTYTVRKLGSLIRAGFINGSTQVLPPGAPKFYEAKEISDLHDYFRERARRNKSYKK